MSRDEWLAFRQAREAELVQPFGWLCLEAFHWLPETPSALPGLPGRWWQDGDQGWVEATVSDGLLLHGGPFHAAIALTVAPTERRPWVSWRGKQIELLNRGDRYAIRVRAETSRYREAFTGVPTWDYDPSWVVEGMFTPDVESQRVEVATIRPELRQRIKALGNVEFSVDGQPQRLLVTSIKSGLGIEFYDPTNCLETAAWRQLKFDDPDESGRVRLDFNETLNMWFAFTDYATCPKPVPDNTITVAVTAGEKLPR